MQRALELHEAHKAHVVPKAAKSLRVSSRFRHGCDQAVIRIDSQIPQLCQICFILGSFYLQMTEPTRFIRMLDHSLLYGQGRRQRLWNHTLNQQFSNGLIQLSAGNPLKRSQSLLNPIVGIKVIRSSKGLLA